MEGTNEEILISIRYYQERLEKYSRNKNEDKILYVITKLERLPIKTFHLENTGVGRTVNGLKKMGGNIAEAAKNLVAQWKDMVREEERNSEMQETENGESTANCSHSSEEVDTQHEHIQHNVNEEYQKASSDNESFREDHERKSSDTKRSNHNHKHKDIDRKENKHKNKNEEGNNNTEERKHKVKTEDREDTRYKTNDERSRHKSDDKRESKKHKSDRHSKIKEQESGQKSHRHHKNGDRLKNEDKHVHSHADGKMDVQEGSSKPIVHKSSDTGSAIKSEYKSRNKDKESTYVENEKKSKHKSKHSSSSEKERKHQSDKDDYYEENNMKKISKSKRRRSSSEMSDMDDRKPKSKISKQDAKTDTKHRSNEHERSSKTKENLKLAKLKNSEKLVNGIDSHSGASFEEALGMCGTIVSSKNSTKKKSEKPNIVEKNDSLSKPLIDQDEEEDDVPPLLKQPNLEPLNLNIASLLPEITPNYRPLGLPIDSQPRRILTDDEALSRVMMNKNQRTKVYSGNKTHGKVETLFNLCVRVLQDNIDALEYTGGVPYIILKPVLEKATADQLFNMEHHNPYLVDDTDYLWKRHCEKQFRTKKREEMESWRDMYMRCLDEREARLNAITANIKQSQDKSIPIRTTKLAYVDSVVKPPRNIARKQAKNGTMGEKKPLTPTERLSLLSKSGEASKVAVPNPGGRAVERHSSSTSVLKQKKAPLMAKTLSLFKNRFKR